jgi:serine/threonine-protein kinase
MDALHCVQCGHALVLDTIADRDTSERLREMLFGGGLLDRNRTPDARAPAATTPPAPPVAPMESLEPTPTPQAEPAPTPSDELLTTQRSLEPSGQMAGSRLAGDAMPVAGEIIEGYEITGEIGRGGMGRVYSATHQVTGQEVALKMLLPQLSADRRIRGRFFNEARVLAKLEHPNLVPLLGFIESGTRAFIIMPFIRGETLERALRREGRLPLPRVAELFSQMCAGIEHVHSHELLHRDLKPSNVIIRPDGRVMITDFGIARVVGAEKITLPGMVVGTAEYLAPEQASGTSRDDKRSDVYALGIVLYEMLTGRVPFEHPNAGEVLQRQVSAPPPPPRLVVPTLSEAIEAVVLRALQKDPERRFQSATEFSDAALAALRRGTPPAPAPAVANPPRSAPAPSPAAARRDPPVSKEAARPGAPESAWSGGRIVLLLLGLATLGAVLGAVLSRLAR